MFNLFLILIVFAATAGLTYWLRKILLARAVLDTPNERSSHTVPVPRGGGWAMVAVLLPVMLVTELMYGVSHLGLIGGVILLALVSWQDDRKGVPPPIRLGIHILAAWLGSLSFDPQLVLSHGVMHFVAHGPISPQLLFGGFLPFWLDRTVMIIGWAWFMNLYNFMDGIDGITCAETICIAAGSCLLLTAANINDPFAHVLAMLLIGVCLGFLVLNWHPAKIFMGDVGSVPLGYLTGFLLLAIAVKGYLIPALLLPLYYLADSGITITKRALRGEKIWQPHRQHFYQRAAMSAGRHDRVVIGMILANLALIFAALAAVTQPATGLVCGAVIVAILLGKMHNWPPASK